MERHPDTLTRKSKTHQVTQVAPYHFEVVSGHSGETYHISRSGNFFACNCNFQEKRHVLYGECSHVLAVRAYVAKEIEDRKIKAYATRQEAQQAHRKIEIVNDGLAITSRK